MAATIIRLASNVLLDLMEKDCLLGSWIFDIWFLKVVITFPVAFTIHVCGYFSPSPRNQHDSLAF
jgi:hypothetical protein